GGAVGVPLIAVEAAGVFEDLTDTQFGEKAHGQDDPEDDLAGEGAASGVKAIAVLEDLPDFARRDNQVEDGNLVEDALGLTRWQGARLDGALGCPLLLAFAAHRSLLALES